MRTARQNIGSFQATSILRGRNALGGLEYLFFLDG